MKVTGIMLIAFCFGYIANDITQEISLSYINNANAEVAGMDSRALVNDADFVEAVEHIVENCDVDGEYLYC